MARRRGGIILFSVYYFVNSFSFIFYQAKQPLPSFRVTKTDFSFIKSTKSSCCQPRNSPSPLTAPRRCRSVFSFASVAVGKDRSENVICGLKSTLENVGLCSISAVNLSTVTTTVIVDVITTITSISIVSVSGAWNQGMAEEEKTLVEILEENNPIDMIKYISYVTSPQAGAIATFSGTTRDTFEGKTVVELRYEAYVPMAIRCIKSICSLARASWNLHSIAVVHRLGPVPVAEISIFIAVSAVHRADALDACRFLIDELKASVPIWKKEVYANGEVWKENSEFIERRFELGKKDGACCGREVEVKAHDKRTCCGTKVKVDDEVIATSSNDK